MTKPGVHGMRKSNPPLGGRNHRERRQILRTRIQYTSERTVTVKLKTNKRALEVIAAGLSLPRWKEWDKARNRNHAHSDQLWEFPSKKLKSNHLLSLQLRNISFFLCL